MLSEGSETYIPSLQQKKTNDSHLMFVDESHDDLCVLRYGLGVQRGQFDLGRVQPGQQLVEQGIVVAHVLQPVGQPAPSVFTHARQLQATPQPLTNTLMGFVITLAGISEGSFLIKILIAYIQRF